MKQPRHVCSMALLCAVAIHVVSIAHGQYQPQAAGEARHALSVEAKQRHRAAVSAFAHKHYEDAIKLFMEADKLQPSPAIAYNVARAYEALQEPALALDSYRSYLARAGHPNDEQLVLRRIAYLSRQLARRDSEREALPAASPDASADVEPASPSASPELPVPSARAGVLDADSEPHDSNGALPANRFARAPPWSVKRGPPHDPDTNPNRRGSAFTTAGVVTLAAGAAALGGALVFEELRLSAQTSARAQTEQIKYADALQTMESRQTLARVLAATGGVVVLGGLTLVIIGANARTDSDARGSTKGPMTQLALSFGLASCRLTVHGRY